eukprot:TRINITY_DN17583_c0_g1_i1.p1 TRINITY_DN17583_c0_g1~~TRINITY_DN17583_c0_g1_i1.p1  ORF type:complete len:418 (+),score=104.75 TRINITY_DN17583_c0_g1_i1:19-1272(+)
MHHRAFLAAAAGVALLLCSLCNADKDFGCDFEEEEDLEDLVLLQGGEFVMGTNDTGEALFDDVDGESPARVTFVSPFKISRFAVSNSEFAKFVAATGYKTVAEEFGWSFAFEDLMSDKLKTSCEEASLFSPWWVKVSGADWRHPQGPDSSIKTKMDHPVTQMSYLDAQAYCHWRHKDGRLPTEAEWEFAARGGKPNSVFPWGDDIAPDGKHRMNVWQSSIPKEALPTKNFYLNGEYYIVGDPTADGQFILSPPSPQKEQFMRSLGEDHSESLVPTHQAQEQVGGLPIPVRVELEGMEKVMASITVTHVFYSAGNSLEDGFEGTAPVNEYGPQNDYGMYNMVGNVWEWVADWWTTHHNVSFPVTVNPKGPSTGEKRVLKGGSFICNWLTCPRMRPSGRKGLPEDSGSDSLGFRCAADP